MIKRESGDAYSTPDWLIDLVGLEMQRSKPRRRFI